MASGEQTVWLSGAILTFLNKLLFPTLWLAALTGLVLGTLAQYGRISLAPGFRFLGVAVLAATGLLVWLTARLQRVGYRGRELVVANYWREEGIPFEQVEAAEPVWWYWRRMVRVRFRARTSFGWTVYYLPKWGFVRCFFQAPEEELRALLAADADAPSRGFSGEVH